MQAYPLAIVLASLLCVAQDEPDRDPRPETLKFAACQIINGTDMAENTTKIIQWVETAAGDGVDVLLFPEACLVGYVKDTEVYRKLDTDAVAAAESQVIEAARCLDIAVILGSVHWENGDIYNSLLVIDKGGIVRGRYSKSYLAEEWPRPGTTLPVFSVAGVPSCFVICHDIRYPELVRLPAIAGARVCYFSSHESGLLQEHKLSAYRAMPISRATENGVFLVMANAAASARDLEGSSHGNSKVVHPDGNILAEAGHFEECLVTVEIRVNDATGGMAMNAVDRQSTVSEWLRQGAGLVVVHGAD
jgi:predicted amidohydrolase